MRGHAEDAAECAMRSRGVVLQRYAHQHPPRPRMLHDVDQRLLESTEEHQLDRGSAAERRAWCRHPDLELRRRPILLGDGLDCRHYAEVVEDRRVEHLRHLPNTLHDVDDLPANSVDGTAQLPRRVTVQQCKVELMAISA